MDFNCIRLLGRLFLFVSWFAIFFFGTEINLVDLIKNWLNKLGIECLSRCNCIVKIEFSQTLEGNYVLLLKRRTMAFWYQGQTSQHAPYYIRLVF